MMQRTAGIIIQRVPLCGVCLAALTRAARLRPPTATGVLHQSTPFMRAACSHATPHPHVLPITLFALAYLENVCN